MPFEDQFEYVSHLNVMLSVPHLDGQMSAQTDGAADALLDFSKPVLSELVLVGEDVRREGKGDNINYKEVVRRKA